MVNRETMRGGDVVLAEEIRKLRNEYRRAQLTEESVHDNPFLQLEMWLREAIEAKLAEPNAMALATVGVDGQPSVRAVLFKALKGERIIFFSNYESRKGREIELNRKVSLMFLWEDLERQVRIEGSAERLSREDSEAYFLSRPRGAQIAAMVSVQSAVISSRAELEERYRTLEARFAGAEVPCPAQWGGYAVSAHALEFWQGRENRLHDRILFRQEAPHAWRKVRLAP